MTFKIISKNKLPKWMSQKIKLNSSTWYKPLFDHHPLDHFQTRKIKSRIEHYGYTEGRPDTEETIYISQPYGLTYHWIKNMVEKCEKYGIKFDIRGDSDHLPGRTVMVEWYKKDDPKKQKPMKAEDFDLMLHETTEELEQDYLRLKGSNNKK